MTTPFLLGVNLAAAEFGNGDAQNGHEDPNTVPGVFGKDYTYPTHAEIDYYVSKGLTVIRLPFLWERLQLTKLGPLDPAELGRLDDVVNYATSQGLKVVIDPHNYGYGFNALVGSADTPNSYFADLWSKLASHYKSNPDVIFGLMNEPHVQSPSDWLVSVNAAIAAIRSTGAMQQILVPGTAFDGAWTWQRSGNEQIIGTGVQDPAHNFAFEVHQYLDKNGSGTDKGVVSATIGVERITEITQWAKTTGNHLFLGEVGVFTDQTSLTALDKMLTYIQQNTDVWEGVTYWAGGPWWPADYILLIEPQPLDGPQKPQMTVLLQHLPPTAEDIQKDHFGITRLPLPEDQAAAVANVINLGTQTETQYVSWLLSQASNTSVAAVAVEASMYGALGTSDEVTSLVSQFLPSRVEFALQHGFDPQVYASESVGLAFAFSNETGGTAFADAYGPIHPAMPNSAAGDLAFANAAAKAIFGSASTENLVNAMETWVANWKAFYTVNGIPGLPDSTADQADLAARGAAWGDAVGMALSDDIGPLETLVHNFLMGAAQETSDYTVSLLGQPPHYAFQGEVIAPEVGDATSAHLLSLAGGGIKAMTADAGLFAGLLQHFSSEGISTTIGDLLSKVSAVSANSGSSWFTDLLAYSTKFENSLTNYNDFFNPEEGYMGELKTAYYNYATAPSNDVNEVIVAILNAVGDLAGMNLAQLYGLLANSSIDWNDFLSNVIFQPDNSTQLLQSVTFHSDHSLRTDSLPSQSLIFQSSISSNDAAINKYESVLGFTTNETVSTITNAGADSLGHDYIFIPAVITSLGSETDISAPALPSISGGSLDVTYSTYDFGSHSATTVLPNFNFDGLSAFLATSASSAALSAVASGGVYDSGGVVLSALLNEVQNISPLVQVNNANGISTASDPASGILNGDTTPAFLVTQGNSLLRLADGAYIDNTSVTSGLTYLQANSDLSNFTATALTYFDGVDSMLGKINPDYNNIGKEAAVLFTGSDQNQTYSVGDFSVNLSHPSAAVFDSTKTTGLDKPFWEYSGSNGFKLEYFKLGVTTADNNEMGIAPNEQGTLNLWMVTTTATALPSLDQTSWAQYADLFIQMIDGLQSANNGYIGADLLACSLGLGSDQDSVELAGISQHLDHVML